MNENIEKHDLQIKNVQVTTVEIPLEDPKRFGARCVSKRHYTIVEITTEGGITGWGYCWGSPAVSLLADSVKDLLIGEPVTARERIWKTLYHNLAVWDRRGITCRVLGAVDIALWDAIGKYAGLPLYQLLGGYRDEVQAYLSGGYYPLSCVTEADLLRYMENDFGTYRDKGFRAFKMKIGGMSPAFDQQRVALAREVIGKDAMLMVDANNNYDVSGAIRMAESIEKYDIAWFEEPVPMDDLDNCAEVAKHISMPVAIGENHFTRWDFKEILEHKAASIFQGDPTLMGGITEWEKMAGLAATYGVTLAPHWTHDLNVHIALARPEVKIVEYFEEETDIFNVQKILVNPVKADKGMLRAAEGPGHGLILDRQAVEKYRI